MPNELRHSALYRPSARLQWFQLNVIVHLYYQTILEQKQVIDF